MTFFSCFSIKTSCSPRSPTFCRQSRDIIFHSESLLLLSTKINHAPRSPKSPAFYGQLKNLISSVTLSSCFSTKISCPARSPKSPTSYMQSRDFLFHPVNISFCFGTKVSCSSKSPTFDCQSRPLPVTLSIFQLFNSY